MNLRVMSFGLAALCALALAAAMPSFAAAAGETASTCVSGGAEFGNEHCTSTSGSSKAWKEVAIKAGEETQLTLAAIGEQVLSTKVGEVSPIIKATGVECAECMAKNQEAEGVADFTSSGGHLRYTGVTINVASCKVTGGEYVTEPLKFTSSMLTYMKMQPVSGTTVAVIHLEKSGTEPCVLGSSITVHGEANLRANGATLTLESALTVGEQAASLTGEWTMSAGPTGGEHHAISLSVSKATGETLSTCVEAAGTGEFGNAHCTTTATGGNWKEVGAKEGEETQLTLAATSEIQEIKTKIGLATVTIKATGVECVECMGKNQELAGGAMDFTSSGGHLRFTGATISTPTCKVAGGAFNSEPLKFTSTMPDSLSVTEVGEAGWATINLEKSGTEACALGSGIHVTGHITVAANGSTLTAETGVEELLVGTQKATFKGEWTMSGGLTAGEHHAVVFTQA